MPSSVSQLAPRMEERQGPLTTRSIFDYYAEVPALFKRTKKPGEAIKLFQKATEVLETKLKNLYSNLGRPAYEQRPIADYHALLALIHWLYPSHTGLNRLNQAAAMFRHATAAVVTSKSSQVEPLSLGLLIQLRILPFLIRSKKAEEEQLARVREVAKSFTKDVEIDQSTQTIESLSAPGRLKELGKRGLSGLVFEAMGFSYYQFERNRETALSFLNRAVNYLSEITKQLARKLRKNRKSRFRPLLAKLSFYQAMSAVAYWDLGACYESKAEGTEGDEMLSLIRIARTNYDKAYKLARRTPWHVYTALSSYNLSGTYAKESEYQLERKKAAAFLKKAVILGDQSLRLFKLWSTFEADFLGGSWVANYYQQLGNLSEPKSRKRMMARSLYLAKKAEALVLEGKLKHLRYTLANIGDIFYNNAEYCRQVAIKLTSDSVRATSGRAEKEAIGLLRKALDNCLKSKTFYKEDRHSNRAVDALLLGGDICYELMNSNLEQTQKEYFARVAKRQCNNSIKIASKLAWNERIAESNWRLAQILDREGKFQDSASHFLKSYEAYEIARRSSEHGKIYEGFSKYMLAWNRIELAKIAHRSSDFQVAAQNYVEASKFIAETKRWHDRANLFRAESLIDRAEKAAIDNRPQESIDYFSKAIKSLSKFGLEIKKDEFGDSARLEESAHLLTTFCRARMILEKSKEEYRFGNVQQSISGLNGAEKMFRDLAASHFKSDPLRANELGSLASLCEAMKSFQRAQIDENPGLYLHARSVFEKAAEVSTSKSLKPLLSGLANFAAFLYFSKELEKSLDTSFDVEKIVACDEALANAEVMFRKVGNKSFLNMLRASKHILDATIKMSAAERELENAEARAKLYTQAQRSLSYASKYYEQLGSSKRVKESLKMIGAVRNHQRLIPLAHDIIAEVASSQIIYNAIASSTALEQAPNESVRVMDVAFIEVDVEVPKPYVTSNEPLTFVVSLSNLGKRPAIAVRIDEIVPEELEIERSPYPLSVGRSLRLNIRMEPASTKHITIHAHASRGGDYVWNPSLIYLDHERNYKVARSQTVRAVVEPAITPDMVKILSEKGKLEKYLAELSAKKQLLEQNSDPSSEEIGKLTEEIFRSKEKVSKIEEEILRVKNEYQSMQAELGRVRSDISSLKSLENEIARTDDIAGLEMEEKLLVAKIERRRRLLEQACQS